jgi:3-dehydroquinate synthase
MTSVTKTVRVELGDRAYDIQIGPGLIAEAGQEISSRLKGKRMAVITDEHVAPHYLDALTESLKASDISVYPLTCPPAKRPRALSR